MFEVNRISVFEETITAVFNIRSKLFDSFEAIFNLVKELEIRLEREAKFGREVPGPFEECMWQRDRK